jgi:hypothetical protein
LFPGTKLTIEGETFIVPALSLGQLRNGVLAKLQEHDKLLSDGKFFESYLIRGEVIVEALKRNYPTIDEAKIMDGLDLQNLGPVWLNVLGSSGFTPGEGVAAETAAIAPGTSDPSTAA